MKRQRQNVESSDELVQSQKFNDLNDFCLLNIFGHLDLQSLLNVANTSKRLQELVLDVYKRRFGEKTVSISVHEHGDTLRESSDGIRIRGLKTILQYLRCFGPLIHGLSIGYCEEKSKHYVHVHEYVNDFCAQSLVRIEFRNLPNIAIEQFQKVFVNIQDVSFEQCDLGEKWPSFVQWFSNLRSLSFDEVRMVYRSIKTPFQNLEHLRLNGLRCDGFKTIKIAADLLDGINQLKSLDIAEREISITELLDLIKNNPSISKLRASEGYGHVSLAEVQRLVNKHPALVELDLESYHFLPDEVVALTRQLGSLKLFQFYTQVNYLSDERSHFESQLADGGWEVFVGSSGCDLRTFRYDMWVTINRKD